MMGGEEEELVKEGGEAEQQEDQHCRAGFLCRSLVCRGLVMRDVPCVAHMVLTGELVRTVSMERWEQEAGRGLEPARGGKTEGLQITFWMLMEKECKGQ